MNWLDTAKRVWIRRMKPKTLEYCRSSGAKIHLMKKKPPEADALKNMPEDIFTLVLLSLQSRRTFVQQPF
jgi:hypothetical protein